MRPDRSLLAGFTLIEALVALTILLAFSAVVGPMLFQSRCILSQGTGAVSADLLLRSLINAPLDRSVPGARLLEGRSGGFIWRVSIEPYYLDVVDILPRFPANGSVQNDGKNWTAYHVVARVFWGHGQTASAETLRLGKAARD